MKRAYLYAGILLLAVGGAFADQPTTVPGQQTIVAHRARQSVVLDGFLGAAEWAAAVPVHVDAVKPVTAPGVVPDLPVALPFLTPPDNQDDSSFTIRAIYDDDNLYVAVTVADDILLAPYSWPNLWLNDDVEILIDGDRQPWDFADAVFGTFGGAPNKEGYQLVTSVDGAIQTEPENNPEIQVWESQVGLAPRGFVVEVRIPLDMINTHDTSWWSGGTPGFRRPEPGDIIGFNVCVGDNDSGYGYAVDGSKGDSFTAWDGNGQENMWGEGYGVWYEQDWGKLYFAP